MFGTPVYLMKRIAAVVVAVVVVAAVGAAIALC